MVNRYIVPVLGKLPLEAVERVHVTELQHRLHQKSCVANMVVGTLSLMYRLAEGWGLVPEGCNPCRSVARYPQRKRERFLTDTEFTRLTGALLDRLTHHVNILVMNGQSFRLNHSRARKQGATT